MRRVFKILRIDAGLSIQSLRGVAFFMPYKLCDLCIRFPVDERGTMKSVVEYFKETYGFVIQHTQCPCLQVGNPQRPNYLPMEVCAFLSSVFALSVYLSADVIVSISFC